MKRKLKIKKTLVKRSKAWYKKNISKDTDYEIGAGIPPECKLNLPIQINDINIEMFLKLR